MPGDDQQLVAGKEVPEYIGIRKNSAQHQRPCEDASAVHRVRRKHVLTSEHRLPDQCPRNAVCNGVHGLSLSVPRAISILADEKKWTFLGQDVPDAAGGNVVLL